MAVFTHAARTPSLVTTAIRLKPILSKPLVTEKIQPIAAKTAIGHKLIRKP